MKKWLIVCAAAAAAVCLAACGQQTQQDPEPAQNVDLRAAYDEAIAIVDQELGDEAPVLLEETNMEYIGALYPGLESIELKQSVFFLSPTATSCEVVMVEAANESDVETIRTIFQSRVDTVSNDTTYPEEAGMWKNCATISVSGSYVVLEVLPEGCTVPDAFLAKF